MGEGLDGSGGDLRIGTPQQRILLEVTDGESHVSAFVSELQAAAGVGHDDILSVPLRVVGLGFGRTGRGRVHAVREIPLDHDLGQSGQKIPLVEGGDDGEEQGLQLVSEGADAGARL